MKEWRLGCRRVLQAAVKGNGDSKNPVPISVSQAILTQPQVRSNQGLTRTGRQTETETAALQESGDLERRKRRSEKHGKPNRIRYRDRLRIGPAGRRPYHEPYSPNRTASSALPIAEPFQRRPCSLPSAWRHSRYAARHRGLRTLRICRNPVQPRIQPTPRTASGRPITRNEVKRLRRSRHRSVDSSQSPG
jgi:hypothetical protein